ncbi:hypothetical protein ABKN59_011940 [Abortiporus biennis]
MMRYGLSKLCNVLYIHELQRRLDVEGLPIVTLLVNPGGIRTDRTEHLLDSWNFIVRWLYRFQLQQFPTPDIAAHNSVFAAAAPIIKAKPEIYKTCYLDPIAKIGDVTTVAKDEALQKELWEMTEHLLQDMVV